MTTRNVTRHPVSGRNSLRFWPEAVHPLKVVWFFLILNAGRYSPSFQVKNFLYRMIGMKIGRDASLALMVMPDTLFPSLIEIGDNVVIGYNTTILAHEFLREEWRTGPVVIGNDVVIGANCTILPGVVIGEGAVVSAMSLVNRDIPPHSFWGGVPVKELRRDR